MQHEITQHGKLLNEDGSLAHRGWSRQQLLEYNRENISAGWYRIKEWDYYCALTSEYGIALTVADNGYMGLISISWLDFNNHFYKTDDIMKLFTKGKLNLPRSSGSGNIYHEDKDISIEIVKNQDKRILSFDYPNFHDKRGIKGNLTLTQDPDMDTMAIATPFSKKNHFYYNQKINCMPAEGTITYSNNNYSFLNDTAFGVLDWGRGVWPYANMWYWGSASGKIDGKPFGFNLGYGFGDTSLATENIVFYNKIGYKLEHVYFNINPNSYERPWAFTSNDGRFEMNFTPIFDRYSNTNIILLKSVQHQVFGHYNGKVILDDGDILHVKNLLGFAEKVQNRW
ncbi:MAG: DUF2804 domain-containing protein [Candidatus Methanolliviera hydrocarbonicum]|uniref:DUF2804 domain-containing protein n=1 Tax=Candidatus Methanolliviera hydrocarbonicum TaxID=2491085 RepID=A0A520KYY2_9EURY|nr:MAG: DUF2804 domain-containing protein [Candidatus Methanolliviera hydrocarbonicum]